MMAWRPIPLARPKTPLQSSCAPHADVTTARHRSTTTGAIVERFLESGAAVAIWDRDVALAEKTAVAVKNRGRAIAVACDVTRLADVERARDDTLKAFGRLDILVNNAGIAGPNAKTWEYE